MAKIQDDMVITNGEFADALNYLYSRGIAKKKLAQLMSVSTTTVGKWMQGHAPITSRQRYMYMVKGLEDRELTMQMLEVDPMTFTLALYATLFKIASNITNIFQIYCRKPSQKAMETALKFSKDHGVNAVALEILRYDYRTKRLLQVMIERHGVNFITVPNRVELSAYVQMLQAVYRKKGHLEEYVKQRALKEAKGDGRISDRLKKLRETDKGKVVYSLSKRVTG